MYDNLQGAIKVSSSFRYCKTKTTPTQLTTIFSFLKRHTATATMVAAATSIPQKNICRYKKDMELAGILWEVRKAKCKCTGRRAWYITTNPALRPGEKEGGNE